MKNTKKRGLLRFFIYRKKGSKEFTAVCLELGLIEFSQNPDYLKQSIVDAARGYVHTIIKENLSDDLLNLKPSREYRNMYLKILEMLAVEKNEKEEKPRQTLNDVLAFSKSMNNMLTPSCI